VTKISIDQNHLTGPFDIIGDVHGCFDELMALMNKLGYEFSAKPPHNVSHPEGRILVFVGDLVDRGPKTPDVLRVVMEMCKSGIAFCVTGNHEDKLKRALMGNKVTITNGLEKSLNQLSFLCDAFKYEVIDFLDNLPIYLWLDNKKLAVSHAGIKESFLGLESSEIRHFCLYGPVSIEPDLTGLPKRLNWELDYSGDTLVVYGHRPIETPTWTNKTINIDTGCVFGGKLTALRYPEIIIECVMSSFTYNKLIGTGRVILDKSPPSN